jgi:predicted alpha/beta-fold hydrolase
MPIMILLAEDDPVVPVATIDVGIKLVETNSNMIIVVTKNGGHAGWYTGAFKTPYWINVATEYFTYHLDHFKDENI